jgi:uncharacterized membrane protein
MLSARPMIPDLREPLLVAIRWAHAAAAVLLLGASAFQVFVLEPALASSDGGHPLRKAAELGLKEIVDLTLVVFVLSGALLTFERLSSGAAGPTYAALLGLKVVLSLALYRWAFALRRGAGWGGREGRIVVGLGFVVLLLATVLKSLYEGGLRS